MSNNIDLVTLLKEVNATPNIQHDNNDLINLLALQELTNSKKIKTNSRIKLEQVELLTKLYLFNDTFKTPLAKKLADLILQLQVSINGLGRKEIIKMINNNSSNDIQQVNRVKDVFR